MPLLLKRNNRGPRFLIEIFNAGDEPEPVTLRGPILLSDILQDTGEIHVIAIKPRENVAGASRKPFVDSMRLPVILFADPVRNPRFVLADDIDALVRTPAIDDDVLEIRIAL